MYCNHCGKLNPKKSNYCQHCGKKIAESVSSPRRKTGKELIPNSHPYPYVISLKKLAILSLATGGGYLLIWFYKQWRSMKYETNWDIEIIWRVILYPYVAYSLFRRVSNEVKTLPQPKKLHPKVIAFSLLVITAAGFLPFPYGLAISLFEFLPLLIVQGSINYYWESKYPGKVQRSPFGAKNLIWSMILGLVTIGFIVGLYIADQQKTEPVSTNAISQEEPTATGKLDAEELFAAINAERAKNKVPQFLTEPSTCALAKIRAADIAEDSSLSDEDAAFKRAMDRVFEDESIDFETAPDSFNELFTYQANPADAITDWKEYEARMLFTSTKFARACVAVKDGFGVVIIGAYLEPVPSGSVSEDQSPHQKEFPGAINFL